MGFERRRAEGRRRSTAPHRAGQTEEEGGGDGQPVHPTLALQRLAGNRAVTTLLGSGNLAVQRHAKAFRIKPSFESPELRDQHPALDRALGDAARALEFGKSKGSAVTLLKLALAQAGHPAGTTDVYDRAMKASVSALQQEHAIPFPTGRQAGPKTLSALDDHLLVLPTPPDKRRPSKRWTLLGGEGLLNTFVDRTSIVFVSVDLIDEFGSRSTMKFESAENGPEHKGVLRDPVKLVISGSKRTSFILDQPALAEDFGGFGRIFYSHAFRQFAAATAQFSAKGSVRFVPIADPLDQEGASSIHGKWSVFARGPVESSDNAEPGPD